MMKELTISILMAIGLFIAIYFGAVLLKFIPADIVAITFKVVLFVFVVSVIHDIRKFMKMRG